MRVHTLIPSLSSSLILHDNLETEQKFITNYFCNSTEPLNDNWSNKLLDDKLFELKLDQLITKKFYLTLSELFTQ
jgi:hypothetical protein